MKMYTKIVQWALLCLVISNIYSQTENDTISLDLTLEDLMKISVTTASKNSESIESAPAVMSVITSSDIEKFGAVNLTEILNRITSVYMLGTSLAPDGMIGMRGKQTEHYNTNVLILLDGRPLRESFHGGYNGVIYNMFPIQELERIEVIRGPGSVLYGTNAYVGVINLITKTAKKEEINVQVRGGAFNTQQTMVNMAKSIGNVDVVAGFTAIHTDGWNYSTTTPTSSSNPTPFKESMYRDNDGMSGHIKLSWKGFTLTSLALRNDWNVLGRTPFWPSPYNYKVENTRVLSDLGYTKKFSDKYTFNANFTQNYFDYKFYSPSQVQIANDRTSSDFLFEISNTIKPIKNLNIVLGGLANKQTGVAYQYSTKSDGTSYNLSTNIFKNEDPWVSVPYYDQTWYSAYLQSDYKVGKFLKIVAGAQANKITNLKWDIVPRFGSILSFNKNIGMKLLYGEAFRAATAWERSSFSPPSVYGNPDLKPEKIYTNEIQLFYTSKNIDASITYFNNFDKNRIGRITFAAPVAVNGLNYSQTYVNAGYISTNGLELENRVKIKSFSFNLGASYSESVNELKQTNYDGLPLVMVKSGIYYSAKNKVDVGIWSSYFSEGQFIGRYSTLVSTFSNGKATEYVDVSTKLSVNLGELVESLPNFTLQMYVVNLLNEKINYQELVQRTYDSLPGRPGRHAYFSLIAKF